MLIGPDNIEKQYTEFIETIYKKIFQNKAEIIRLEQLRDTLLPKLMAGEILVE